MRLWFYKIIHWEYWPSYIIYFPTFIYWIYLAILFRKINFYKFVNPSITNSGLFNDSKFEIYKLFDSRIIPKTILINANANLTLDNNFNYPLIAKPDIGQRGKQVKLIKSIECLKKYHSTIKSNYLIQEYVDFPNELGLFYIRIPNSINGKVVGITLKRLMNVKGNGINNLAELIKKVPRFELQLKRLSKNIDLDYIPLKGEIVNLDVLGNHSLGTEFLSGNSLITEKLNNTFDSILSKIKGFYYGRLDIKYKNFQDLEDGLNFKIIELNGLKSEPTHIYDANYNFIKAQKEIFWYQNEMKKIVSLNCESKTY